MKQYDRITIEVDCDLSGRPINYLSIEEIVKAAQRAIEDKVGSDLIHRVYFDHEYKRTTECDHDWVFRDAKLLICTECQLVKEYSE